MNQQKNADYESDNVKDSSYKGWQVLWYDGGTVYDKNKNCIPSSNMSVEVNSIGTSLTSVSGNSTYQFSNKSFGDVTVEFDLIETNTNWSGLQFSTNQIIRFTPNGADNGSHIRIVREGALFKTYVDDNTPITETNANVVSPSYIRFFCGGSTTMKYKNLIIYKT